MNRTYGLDVHKDSIFACILDEKGGKFFEQRYNTLTPSLLSLRDKLVEVGCGRVATGRSETQCDVYSCRNR